MFNYLFYPTFFLLFLLSFFLIEGEFKFYLFALWSVFIFIFSRTLLSKLSTREKNSFLTKTTTLTLIMAALFSLNIFFSSNVPLTLEKLLFYLVALALFIFFLSFAKNDKDAPKEKLKIPLFLYYLSLSSLVLNIFVLFFTFVPFPPFTFPGMNLLVRIFGHNYYVAYLLLVLPVFWWQFLFAVDQHFASKKEMRFLTILLISSSYIIMIFSLSRLSIFVGFLQLLAIFWSNRNHFRDLLHNQFAYVMVQAFSLVLIALTAISLVLPLFFEGGKSCPVNFSYKEMCKPLVENDRLQYWQKAFWIWQDNPLFGSGLKTFGFASRGFVLENYNYSSYAHNNFFHNLAEGGLATGGFFIFFILYLFHRIYLVIKSNKEALNQFLAFGVGASFLNAMFDLTWNFFVIFSLTLIFVAIILRNDQQKERVSKLCPRFLTLLTLLAVLLACAYFFAFWLIRSNQTDRALALFPFFDQHVRNLSFQKRLSKENYTSLFEMYRSDPDFVYNFSEQKTVSEEERVGLLVEVGKLDPMLLVKVIDLEKMSFRQVKPLTDAFTQIVTTQSMLDNTHFLDYWRQGNLAIDFFRFGNQAYSAGDLSEAADFYHQALFLDPHILGSDTQQLVFLKESDLDKVAVFLAAFQNFNPEFIRDFYGYMDLYQRTLLHLFKQGRLEEFYDLTEKILKYLPNHAWFLIRDLTEISQTQEEKTRLKVVYERFKHLEAWQDFLPLQ